MSLTCPHCGISPYTDDPDYYVRYVESRYYKTKPAMTGAGFKYVNGSTAEEITVTSYGILECSACHHNMIVSEETETITKAVEVIK